MTQDRRLIIEKGGYRPQTAGSTKPPATQGEALKKGYRPTVDGPAQPPATRPPEGTGPKKQ